MVCCAFSDDRSPELAALSSHPDDAPMISMHYRASEADLDCARIAIAIAMGRVFSRP